MDFFYYFVVYIYLSGLIVFLISFKHFLLVLLSLEFVMLAIFSGLFMCFSSSPLNLFFLMIYLTMVVCEGVLGLSIMVSIVRMSGNDNLMSLTSLW